MNKMKYLYKKYKKWASTWSPSQLVFVTVIVIVLSGAGIITAHRLDEAHRLIESILSGPI